jgi:DNA helicase II / ATP-dependent DNA helicase PcrA
VRLEVPSVYQQAIFNFVSSSLANGVVEATAGSGKTTTLVEVAHLIPEDVSTLFLAFNKTAAGQLKEKLPEHVRSGTIHSRGLWVLSSKLTKLGKKVSKDNQKYKNLVKKHVGVLLESYAVPEKTSYQATEYLTKLLDFGRDTLFEGSPFDLANRFTLRPPDDKTLTEDLHQLYPEVLAEGLRLTLEGEADFTDMLYAPVVKKMAVPKKFKFICVDEAQDLTPLQLAFVLKLVRKGGRMLFVGDKHQAIYGFAGADPRSLERIVEITKAKTLPLSVTYRCPSSHVALAKRFSPEIQAAPGAKRGEVWRIADSQLVATVRGGDLLLCRNNAPLVDVALELLRNNIAAVVVGKDLEAVLLRDAAELFAKGLENWDSRLEALEHLETTRLSTISDPDLAERLIQRRLDELAALSVVVKRAVEQGLTTLDELTAFIKNLFAEEARVVKLMSVHRAKGLEADRVFILYPHLMPSSYARSTEAKEGEQCVMFVALTRSKDTLVFVETSEEPVGWWQ